MVMLAHTASLSRLPMTYRLTFLILYLALGGCDFFGGEEGGSFTVTGTVIDAETGAPLAGIGVTLDDGQSPISWSRTSGAGPVPYEPGPRASFVVEEATTGPDGRFRLEHSSERLSGYSLRINDGPYDDRYTTSGDNFYPDAGDVLDYGEIPISRHRTTIATGTVVLTGTGEPLDSVRVAVEELIPYQGYYQATATTMTDAGGAFLVRFERAVADTTYRVHINAPWSRDPPTPYTDRAFDIVAGDTLDLGVIELSHVGD